jgi:hypothetical protein
MHEKFLRKCPQCGVVKLVSNYELAMAGLLREEDRHPYEPTRPTGIEFPDIMSRKELQDIPWEH